MATVTAPSPIAIVADKHDVNCSGDSTGSIDLTTSGGIGSYTYLWNTNPPQVTPDLSNLAAGGYVVTATDVNGCDATTIVLITQPQPLVATLDSSKNGTCNGAADGAIYATVTGGTPPYTYNWSDSIHTLNRTNLMGGTYTLTVIDGHGCINSSLSVTINQPLPLTLSVSEFDSVRCHGDQGKIVVQLNGGTQPYSYLWNTGDTTNTLVDYGGTYSIVAHDSNGCSKRPGYYNTARSGKNWV